MAIDFAGQVGQIVALMDEVSTRMAKPPLSEEALALLADAARHLCEAACILMRHDEFPVEHCPCLCEAAGRLQEAAQLIQGPPTLFSFA